MRGKLVIAIASAVIWAAPARGETPVAQARRQVEAANIDYRLGRFSAALGEYTRAYELYPKAPLLFNIGQCHRNLGNHAEAIFFFEGYLRDAPKTPDRALVEDLIRESREALDRDAAAVPAPDPAAPAPVDSPVAPAAEPRLVPPLPGPPPEVSSGPPAAPAEPRVVPASPGDHGPARSRVVPSLLIAGGVGALAAGATLYYYGQKRGADEKYVYDDTRLLGGGLVVAGAAAIVTGAVLWLRAPEVAGAPVAVVTAGGCYAGWAGSF
jgi:tetratricopeptide (TPR) repeat protein